ncbi:MAG: hypothetical protein KGD59_05735 [Candidatus Heimdallarchaeota archaeon]|nr:hypothetical protein [Candidatus Heimdallarchaeota archaeon]MBY8994033.1 hypothetical protein [Candidatus Heimdallarchaeota archaeon]
MTMNILYKIPLEAKDITQFLEEEKNFLIGFLGLLEGLDITGLSKKNTDIITELKETFVSEVDKIFPAKNPQNQIQALLTLARIQSKSFSKAKIEDLGITNRWVLLTDGYLGSFVEGDYETAILLYLISAIYQTRGNAHVQTSPQYRYYHISSLSALKGAILFMENLAPEEEHYAYPFYQLLLLRKLEIEAEVTKAEAFIARKKGDFNKASKLFAGAASFRFSMMNYDLPSESDNRVKIYASTELGMACFYIAVGYSNLNESQQAYSYLLKAKSYFENAAKLSESNTELLEAANKRLDLVNPYIDRIQATIEPEEVKIDEIADPQPLMVHPDPEPLFAPNDKSEGQLRICSNCIKKIVWADICTECGENIIPFE